MLTATRPATGPRPAPPPPVDQGSSGWAPGDGAAACALGVLTIVSAAALMRVFTGSSWVGPVLSTAAVSHLALWAMRRWRVPQVVAVLVALVVVVLMVSWTVFGSTTYYGFPGSNTWSHVASALRSIRSQVAAGVAPLPPTRSLEMIAAAGAGVVALVADWLAFRWGMPLLAVLPGLAAFVTAAVSGRGPGRAIVVGLEAIGLCGYLILERVAKLNSQVWFAGVRSGTPAWSLRVGGAIAAAGVVTALIVTPFLTPLDGAGTLGWRSGLGLGGGQRVVPNPVVSLRTRLIQLSNTPVFAVQTDIASYWRLTSLDTFTGDTWTSSGAYEGFGSKLPGAGSVPSATRTAHATFEIQGLDSVWLPDQFDPVSVQGTHHVSYDPRSDSLITSQPTSNGMQYSVTSYQYLSTLSAPALRAAPPSAAPAGDLQLPADVGVQALNLARTITRNQPTQYDKALAIEAYLRSPPFSYNLNPPSDGTGISTLYNFLFATHQGYCQQFAGAYAVLARAAGLPTRLAFGFTTGDASTGGYQVRDRDAHTWPEVWFGPRYGWVPFEPTPGFSIPGTTGYAGTSGSASGPSSTPATTLPTSSSTVPSNANKGSSTTLKTTPTTAPSLSSGHRARGSVSAWWIAVPTVLVVLIGWLAFSEVARSAYRRRRVRRAATRGPEAVVLEVWDQLRSDLAWDGLRGSATETHDEFAQRAVRWLDRRMVRGPWHYGGITALASLVRQAAFAQAAPSGAADEARRAAGEIRTRLRAVEARSVRLRRAVFLPPRRS